MLEGWQLEFFGEALAVDEGGAPYFGTVVLIVPRKNGKTTATSGTAAYVADEQPGKPIVGLAATSDEQASELFDAIDGFVQASGYLRGRYHVRDYDGEIARVDASGYIRRMSMDWRRLHGKNLALLLADEIHAWTTENLRRCWEALTTGDGARPDFQVICITTEGEEDPSGRSILDQLVSSNEEVGEVEDRPGLRISRDHDARVLVYRFHATMPAADPQPVRDAQREWRAAKVAGRPAREVNALRKEMDRRLARCVEAVKLANPASWITKSYLAKKVLDPKLSRAAFLRYHACVKASSSDAWISGEEWDALAEPGLLIGEDRPVALGLDGSRTHDSTVIAAASPRGDLVDVSATVFSAVESAPHHVLHGGGRIDYDDIEGAMLDCFDEWDVREAAADPRYLLRSIEILERRLDDDVIATVEPQSRLMRDALATFDRLVREGRIRHNGDPVLRAHILAAVVERDPHNGAIRRVRRRDPESRIDAAIALSLAVWRATLMPIEDGPMVDIGDDLLEGLPDPYADLETVGV